MAGTKILQSWALPDGRLTIEIRSDKPLESNAFGAVGELIDAIETFVYALTGLPDKHVHNWIDITAHGDLPNSRYVCNGCEKVKFTDSNGNQLNLEDL